MKRPPPVGHFGTPAGVLGSESSAVSNCWPGALPAHFQQTAGAVLIAPACGFVETITAPSIKAASA
jgi:hypothetical protein